MLPMISAGARTKKRHMAMAAGFFCAMALLFSCGRRPLGFVNSWLLAMTGEVKVGEGASGDVTGQPSAPGGTSARTPGQATAQTPPPPKKVPLKDHLPKTPPVHIVWLDRLPPRQDDPRLIKVPPLRQCNGEEGTDEQTDLWLATDGTTLHVRAFCHDAKPDEICSGNSQADGRAPWLDDSVEIFLMKDQNASHYLQYVVSAAGVCVSLYLKGEEGKPTSFTQEPWPADLRRPYAETKIVAAGYWVDVEIDLHNLGLARIAPGDELRLQFVRNYRKSGSGRIYVHLFPVQIYGDGGSISNHHRGAFQPVKVVGPR